MTNVIQRITYGDSDYELVELSGYQTYLKKVGYGFIAEFWFDRNSDMKIRPWNAGCDMDKKDIQNIIETILGKA